MGDAFESTPRRPRKRRRPRTEDEQLAVLEDLGRRFAAFRQEHRRGTRVPDDLRSAVLVALRKGVPPGEVYRSCGVTWGQILAWKGQQRSASARRGRAGLSSAAEARGAGLRGDRRSARLPRASRGAKPKTDVRVFSVVDAPMDRDASTSPSGVLELRLGPWSISVRLDEPGARRRG